MNMQGIGSQDAWNRFMKLTQDARLRNSGLTSVNSNSSVSKKNSQPFSVNSQKTVMAPLTMTYSKSESDIKKVILGGRFDAYA